jgi:hypothetical protein
MKLLVLILAAELVSSMPQKDSGPRGQRKGKADPGTIIRCMAENWGHSEKPNNAQIRNCTKCFKNIKKSSDPLAKAKQCTTNFLPTLNEACDTQIAALTNIKDEEKVREIVECFDTTLETRNNQRCLDESKSTNTTEKLTQSTMCVLDSWKFAMAYVKKANRRKGRKGRKQEKEHAKKGKAVMMELLTKAHCDLANGEGTANTETCFTCFQDIKQAREDAKKLGNGRKGRKGKMSPEILAALTTCSSENLRDRYSHCTAMMGDKTANKKDTHKCFMEVLISNEVSKCTSEDSSDAITTDVLSSVMDCGKKNILEWVKKNSPEVAEKIEAFLDDDDDDEDDEDDEDDDEMKG